MTIFGGHAFILIRNDPKLNTTHNPIHKNKKPKIISINFIIIYACRIVEGEDYISFITYNQ